MTDAPKIDTQAPDMRTKMLADEMLAIAERLGEGKDPFATWEVIEAIIEERDGLRDLADARAAAAAQAMREAAVDACHQQVHAANQPFGHKSAHGAMNCREAVKALPLPDTTALDRLIAERVREARIAALREAAVIIEGIERHMLTDDCGVMVPDRFDEGTSAAYEAIMGLVTHLDADQGSKEGRDG